MMRPLVFVATFAAFAPAAHLAAQDLPERLPLSAYVDSAALHRALLAAPEPPPGTSPNRLLFQMTFGEDGELKEVQSLACRPPAGEYENALASLIRAHVRPQSGARKRTGEIVRVRGGGAARVEIADHVREDRPVVADERAVGSHIDAVAKRIVREHPELKNHEVEGIVRMIVTDSGTVASASFEQSTTVEAVNAGMLEVARAIRFRPAAVNRCPVAVLVEMPITFTFPD